MPLLTLKGSVFPQCAAGTLTFHQYTVTISSCRLHLRGTRTESQLGAYQNQVGDDPNGALQSDAVKASRDDGLAS